MKSFRKIYEKLSKEPRFWYFLCLFIICLLVHAILASTGWKNTLCGWHGFRQTQTAITSYYTIKEGFRIDYITPVLGKPWSIPMEFPLYQWIVAVVVLITGINLDQAGRLTTLMFFYLSLIPIYHLLGYFIAGKSHRLIFLCLILASPYYIFWSRCFMIESVALFLGLVFLVLLIRTLLKPSLLTLMAASIIGTLAALTKITTFMVFLVPAFFFFIWGCLPNNRRLSSTPPALIKKVIYSCIIIGFILIISLWWTKFADNQKLLNPMAADFITSSALTNWNFGTLAQRLSPSLWLNTLRFSAAAILGFECIVRAGGRLIWLIVPAICVVILLLNRRFGKYALLCFLAFLFGPLVFMNLYVVHDYYFYANGIFLSITLGFVFISFLQKNNRLFIIRSLPFLICLAIMYITFFSSPYYRLQKRNDLVIQPLARAVNSHTEENDVILIYGFDWNSELPYYSQRRALMDRWELPIESDKFQRALKALGDDKITAMVIGQSRQNDEPFIQQRVTKFNLSPEPVFQSSIGDLYIAKNTLDRR